MVLRFDDWLINQQHREDLIGILARTPSMHDGIHKSSKRKSDEHKLWADVVIRLAEPGYIAVFNEAWQEFLLAKQAANDSPD